MTEPPKWPSSSVKIGRETLMPCRTAPQDQKSGGVSQRDLPISNVVYPSRDDGADAPYRAHGILRLGRKMRLVPPRLFHLTNPTVRWRASKSDPLVHPHTAEIWQNRFPHRAQCTVIRSARETCMSSTTPLPGLTIATPPALSLSSGPGQFKHVYPPLSARAVQQ